MNVMRPRIRSKDRWWLRLHPLAAGVDKRVPVQWVTKRTIVSRTHGYCYFRIPKCANSTVVNTLALYDESLGANSGEASLKAIRRSARGLFRTLRLSPKTLGRDFFCFTIVRNPFSRVLSAYLDKIADGVGDYPKVTNALGKDDIRCVSFSEFVDFLEDGGLFGNAHWAPQCSLLPVAPSSLAFVGHVETIEEDLSTLLPKLIPGIDFSGLQSRTDRRRNSNARLREYYTDDLERRVVDLYEEDFRAFAYSRRLPVAGDGP